jgi:acyl-CoA oxidase
VRVIEATASLDPDTDEFVVHSRTISSTKFWPTGLGFWSPHEAVVARTFVRSEDQDPHIFLVQLQSLEDGMPMPDIKMGDVGLKLG